jgi:hypothetical protein
MRFLAMAAAFGVVLAPAALAQGQGGVPTTALTLPMPLEVPANGCAWSGVAFSDGAVIEPLRNAFSYFRCARGSWLRFTSLAEATRPIDSEAEGSSRPPP